MIFLAVIIGLIILFLIIECIRWNTEGKTYGFGICCGLCLATGFVIEIIYINESIYEPHPKAMDVYQGKTTIKYTIRDGIKVDSVVVFKENNYGTED